MLREATEEGDRRIMLAYQFEITAPPIIPTTEEALEVFYWMGRICEEYIQTNGWRILTPNAKHPSSRATEAHY